METKKLLDAMLAGDKFSEWLGIDVISAEKGYCKLTCAIRPEMLNGVGTVHGGVTFAMADSAFAFACNMENNISVALDVHMSFTKAGFAGDVFTVEAKEVFSGRKTGVYDIRITNQDEVLIGLFKGTCYRTGKPLINS